MPNGGCLRLPPFEDPKGIILTHRNYTANVEQASATLPIPEWYTSLLLLPWDHAFAHTAGIYTLMKNGASMASVQQGKTALETLKNVPGNIREIRPTFLLSVPALAKNFRKNIEKGIKEKGPGVEKLFKKALEHAYAYNGIGWDRGENASLAMKLQYKLYDFLIFRKIRQNFGGRLQFFIGGGALLDIELQPHDVQQRRTRGHLNEQIDIAPLAVDPLGHRAEHAQAARTARSR